MTKTMEEPARRLCERLPAEADELPREILLLDEQTAGIVIEQDGVDYMLTMTKVPKQRTRPTRQ